jgi:hypothetical protein
MLSWYSMVASVIVAKKYKKLKTIKKNACFQTVFNEVGPALIFQGRYD